MKELNEMTAWEVVKDLPARFFRLIWKSTSRKGAFVLITILLIMFDVIPENAKAYLFGFVVLVVLFGIEGLKYIRDIKK